MWEGVDLINLAQDVNSLAVLASQKLCTSTVKP